MTNQTNQQAAKPITAVVAMKHWSNEKKCWIGKICQAVRYPNGTEDTIIYDQGEAETQAGIDEWARKSLAARTWAHDRENGERGT